MTIRVVIVADDNVLVREGILRVLEREHDLDVVATCANSIEALAAVPATRPNVVLTDIRMPSHERDDGLGLPHDLRERHPELGVVILSQHVSRDDARLLLEYGSDRCAYLLKDRLAVADELVDTVRIVAEGGCRIDPLVIEALAVADPGAARMARLTPREREILADIAEGLNNDAIAARRVLTRRAVEKHATAVFSKLGLANAQCVSRRVKATLMYLAELDPGS
jgi:DNA-binding NarL/FixJ family response regulator